MIISEEIGGKSNHQLNKYTVKNENGYSFSCINFGATMTSIIMPDREGKWSNILLQFQSIEDILDDQVYFFNKAIGRVAGRIKGPCAEIEGHTYYLPKNECGNTLHGGLNGFHNLWWETRKLENGIEFYRLIHAEEDDFPGIINVSIKYYWDTDNRLHIEFMGTNLSSTPTLFNPTLHSYFNLNTDFTLGLQNHDLTINSNKVAELQEDNIPTGKLLSVEGTAFDFRKGCSLTQMLTAIKKEGFSGYDHPFYVSEHEIATLRNRKNGRQIKLYSDRNALVVYTLNHVKSPKLINGGIHLAPNMGIALEPQTLPDAIHNPGFGNIILNNKTPKSYHIIYELSVEP